MYQYVYCALCNVRCAVAGCVLCVLDTMYACQPNTSREISECFVWLFMVEQTICGVLDFFLNGISLDTLRSNVCDREFQETTGNYQTSKTDKCLNDCLFDYFVCKIF